MPEYRDDRRHEQASKRQGHSCKCVLVLSLLQARLCDEQPKNESEVKKKFLIYILVAGFVVSEGRG